MNRACYHVLLPLISSTLGGVAIAQPSFQGLGSLNQTYQYSQALGISPDGTTVVGSSSLQAFRWTADTGMVGLGQLPPPLNADSMAMGVSAGGDVIVGWGEDYSTEQFPTNAFRWMPATGFIPFGPGTCPSGSQANAVSEDGSVVVGSYNCRPFRWTAKSGMVTITRDGVSGGGFANGVSSDGTVVVGMTTFGQAGLAFRWTQETGPISLGELPGGYVGSVADAVSADGSVVVGHSSSNNGEEGFRWTVATGMVSLGGLPNAPRRSSALSVSCGGDLIVGSAALSATAAAAYIWDPDHGMRNLRTVLVDDYGLADALAGWTLEEAHGISADGRTICGTGVNPDGWGEAWIAHLGDPPCRADFNRDARLNSQDFFDYVGAFFANEPAADFNRDGAINSQDFFDYLAAFFAGCH